MFSFARGLSGIASFARSFRLGSMEVLLERDAEARARARNPERAAYFAECLRGADRRLELLGSVSGEEVSVGTATLLRDAMTMLLAADAAERTEQDEATPANPLRPLCDRLALSATLQNDGAVLLGAADPFAIDRVPAADLARSARALHDIAVAVRAHLDGRSPSQIVRSRKVRVSIASAVLAALLALVIRWLAAPPNVAFHKPVTLSGVDPRGAPPAALVDGVTVATVAPATPNPNVVLTQVGATPFAVIDLKRVYRLREIRVYNRADGYFDTGLPYTVEISEDNTKFIEVGRRADHFGSSWADPPWTVRLDKVSARYVRVRATSYLALSEVEVFAW